MNQRAEHWNDVYKQRAPTEVSWFQPTATQSLELIAASGVPHDAALIDVGAGASLLVDGLLAQGYRDITLVDVAESALAETRRRLDTVAQNRVHYVAADITNWTPERKFGLWHDRAVFHFLTDQRDRAAYRAALGAALELGASAIIGTFAVDGPERCSGLTVARYSAETLAAEFEGVLRPIAQSSETHITPTGAKQSFQFVRFLRV